MSEQIDSNRIVRVLYHTGQLLTAKDFEDEQNYHSKKMKNFFKRFPTGVIRGLEVSTTMPETDESDESKEAEGIYITTGIGVAENGDILVLDKGQKVYVKMYPDDGDDNSNEETYVNETENFLYIPYTMSKTVSYEKLFINIKLKREQYFEKSSPFDVSVLQNREEETVLISFEENAADDEDSITLGMIVKDEKKNFISAETRSRRDVAIVPESYVQFDDSQGHDHSGEGNKGTKIPSEGLVDGAVTERTISANAVTQEKLDHNVRTKPKGPVEGGDLEGTYDSGPTIRPGVITSEKIAAAGEEEPDIPKGNGIRTSHIRKGAVTSEKIAVANPDEIPKDGFGTNSGIHTAHIKDNVITSNKIHDAENESANDSGGYGIKTSHIRNNAVTSKKIGVANSDEIPEGGFNNDHKGIFTAHIQDNAITSNKIHDAGDEQANTTGGCGVKTSHIRNGAVTSDKIALWVEDAIIRADDAGGTGIRTSHIRRWAVTSDKIGVANPDEIPKEGFHQSAGIYTAHIQNNAISSNKIHDAGDEGANDLGGYGIKTSHIRNGAVISDKIAPAGPEGPGDEGGNGIRTSHIRNSAITSDKIAPWKPDQNGIDNVNGIRTDHLKNQAVTCEKLNIVDRIDIQVPNSLTVVIKLAVNAILQIIPVYNDQKINAIKWEITSVQTILREPEYLRYEVKLTKQNGNGNPSVIFNAIKFGECKSPVIVRISNNIN